MLNICYFRAKTYAIYGFQLQNGTPYG